MTKFQLNILGCGSAKATVKHTPSCQVLNVRDNLFMIDCGEGAQVELARQHLKFHRVGHIFISHLHGDHCFGLPGLVSTMALYQRTQSLTIHTFQDGADQFGRLLNYFCREMPFEVKFNVIGTQKAVIYEDDGIKVTSFPLRHRIPCVGFRFDEKPKLRHINPDAVRELNIPLHFFNSLRQGCDWVTPAGVVVPNEQLTTDAEPSISYAYCSDTSYSKRVVSAIEGVDWVYHEATYGDEERVQARKRYHSTAREAAIVAREAGAKQLIIGHYSSRYTDEQPLLRQAQEEFANTRLAQEGLIIDLTKA